MDNGGFTREQELNLQSKEAWEKRDELIESDKLYYKLKAENKELKAKLEDAYIRMDNIIKILERPRILFKETSGLHVEKKITELNYREI